MKKPTTTSAEFPLSADRCENQGVGDWRGEMLAHLRGLIREADPGVVEEWKWRGVPCGITPE